MTVPLYDTDAYIKEATAIVTGCRPAEGGFAVTLDQTLFFPEGGGQPGDTGTIDGVAVLDTYIEDKETVHLCAAPLPEGKTVTLALDWTRRFDHMQQHTGEHILSYAFWRLFDAVNVGFHMNDTFATIDLDRLLTPEEISRGAAFANGLITDDRPVRIYTAKAKELDKKRVRKISKKGGETPRVVDIEQADICTCCGTHVAHTGEVGCVSVIKSEKNRGGSRLTFLCGGRAMKDYEEKTHILHALTAGLSTDARQIPQRMAEMKQELQELRLAVKEKSRALLELQAKELLHSRGESPYVLACLPDAPAPEAKTLLNLLTREPVTAIVVFTKGDSLSFFCGAHPDSKGQSCRTVCDLLCGIYNGKGGGKQDFAQGGGKATADFKERAHSVIKQLIRMS